ncbi:hypothetical protein HU200_026895 [Digitaria exilis]|uniref:S-locus receptor kinase C-terminal domain-containing protein n=1 Tax=Digitaria exilis TaxID=1010633 RepID=A0A835C6T9_9POAL|nr:hypothetical protein HU200_026895 [Digitaria exilis]
MAPEYAVRGSFSTKSDVSEAYCLQICNASDRRKNSAYMVIHGRHRQVRGHWSCWSLLQLPDICQADGPGPQEMLRCIHVGLLCVQEDPHLRPSMASVAVMLNSRSITLPVPAVPAFMTAGEWPRAAAREPSINEVPASDLEPRWVGMDQGEENRCFSLGEVTGVVFNSLDYLSMPRIIWMFL